MGELQNGDPGARGAPGRQNHRQGGSSLRGGGRHGGRYVVPSRVPGVRPYLRGMVGMDDPQKDRRTKKRLSNIPLG